MAEILPLLRDWECQRTEAAKTDPLTVMYSDARGTFKQLSWVASIFDTLADLFRSIKYSGFYEDFLRPIGKVSNLMAAASSIPHVIVESIKATRLIFPYYFGRAQGNISVSLVKIAQRTAETVAGLIKLGSLDESLKLGFLDTSLSTGAKFFKDAFSCVIDVWTFGEVAALDQKAATAAAHAARATATLAEKKFAEYCRYEAHARYAKAATGLVFHGLGIVSLLSPVLVSARLNTTFATFFVLSSMADFFVGSDRKDVENNIVKNRSTYLLKRGLMLQYLDDIYNNFPHMATNEAQDDDDFNELKHHLAVLKQEQKVASNRVDQGDVDNEIDVRLARVKELKILVAIKELFANDGFRPNAATNADLASFRMLKDDMGTPEGIDGRIQRLLAIYKAISESQQPEVVVA